MSRRSDYHRGGYYHIYNRGAHQAPIFRETADYRFVLSRMHEYCDVFSLAPIAYCLMPNHYHLLIRQDGNHRAGLLPQRIFNRYTKAYNTRYQHSGTLFEGPYKVAAVENEEYLLHVCVYIHANPVKDRLVPKLEDWPYSNYREWVGSRNGKLVDRAFVRAYIPDPALYREQIERYLADRTLDEKLDEHLKQVDCCVPDARH
jgi:REP element-mobilizing transposase RayT